MKPRASHYYPCNHHLFWLNFVHFVPFSPLVSLFGCMHVPVLVDRAPSTHIIFSDTLNITCKSSLARGDHILVELAEIMWLPTGFWRSQCNIGNHNPARACTPKHGFYARRHSTKLIQSLKRKTIREKRESVGFTVVWRTICAKNGRKWVIFEQLWATKSSATTKHGKK